jgi:hypothetical protein
MCRLLNDKHEGQAWDIELVCDRAFHYTAVLESSKYTLTPLRVVLLKRRTQYFADVAHGLVRSYDTATSSVTGPCGVY